MSDFSYRFSLFAARDRKSDKSPSQTGNIEIPASEVPALIAWLQSAEPEMDWQDNPVVKLRLAAWDTESKAGSHYLSGKVSPPLPPRNADEAMPF